VFLIYGALASTYIVLILSFVAAAAFGWLTRWLGSLGVAIFLAVLFAMLRAPLRAGLHTVRMAVRQHQAVGSRRPWRTRFSVAVPAIILLGVLLPWPITITGPFVAAPVLSMSIAAPDSGIIQRVQVLEGTRVDAGAPLMQIRNLPLERELMAGRRVTDSLAARWAQARSHGRFAEAAGIEAERSGEAARLAGLGRRVDALRIRALGSGTVITPRPQELVGRWVPSGAIVLQIGEFDSVEIRIALRGAGSTLVRPGSPARLLSDATLDAPASAMVTSISATATPRSVEARLRLPASNAWRPGMTGRASITLQRSNVWGAVWWAIRRAVRSDILL
jgi:multidrug efflux pump subunit AcrA (membrane-fusion protein)